MATFMGTEDGGAVLALDADELRILRDMVEVGLDGATDGPEDLADAADRIAEVLS